MENPIIYIKNFINDLKIKNENLTVEDIKKTFEEKSIMSKYYEQDKLLLIYHKYDLTLKTDLENYSRSFVIDDTTFDIVSYSCQNPICNKEAQQTILNNNQMILKSFRCYEGSLLSLFNHNNKWHLSTRRCLDSKESMWKEVSHWDMFNSVLIKENKTFDEFCSLLDINLGYYFVLVHHNLKNIVDYSNKFGPEYTKLCLAFVRSKETQEEIYDYTFPTFNHIFKSEEITIEQFSEENKNINLNVDNEGIIINTNTCLLKLQTISYQFCKAMGSNSNIFKGYIYLYQNGILKEYLLNYENHKNFGKIINPYNLSETFDIIGVVDSVFKVLTSELFELFKLFWNFKSKDHQNNELYKILPKEYKDILFGLRGLYFTIKSNNLKEDIKHMFGIKDIYNYLKSLESEQICALLRQRKLMFNWIINDTLNNNELKLFKTISSNCDKVHCKLIAIYINKLYPDILSTDIPIQTNKNVIENVNS